MAGEKSVDFIVLVAQKKTVKSFLGFERTNNILCMLRASVCRKV